MKLIVGLGNPGSRYEKTRHNVGFMALNKFSQINDKSFEYSKKLNADIIKNTKFVLIKPLTYMNNSGETVAKAINFYKIEPSNLFVVHDEIDIPFGEIKESYGSRSAGHNGVESIIAMIGTKDFNRIRIGIRSADKQARKTEDFVLERFSKSEESELPQILDTVVDKLKHII